MIKQFLFLFLLGFLMACNNNELTHKEIVTKYYEARNNVNFSKLKPLVSDSITIVSGDYVMPYSHNSFYENFRWDSVFKPSYNLVSLKEDENQIIASVEINSIKNKFLINRPMTCDYLISFNSGKISKIEELECNNVDWQLWRRKVDLLVNWIKSNYPKLDGFIYDMTMKGAINYINAIELYLAHKKK